VATIRKLVTELGFDLDDKGLKEFEKGVADAKSGMLKLTAAVASASAAIFGVTRSAANAADEIFKTARATGVSTEGIQRLGFAASVSGSNMQELGVGLRRLSRVMLDVARSPTSASAEAFQKLGVQAVNADGSLRDTEAVLLDISRSFGSMTNATEKAAIAQELFGRSGGSLVEFLERGPDAIRAASDEFETFGGVMSEAEIKGLKAFNDSVTATMSFLKALKNQLGAQLAPVLKDLIDDFRAFLVENKEIIQTNLTGFVRGLTSFLKTMTRIMRPLVGAFMALTKVMGGAERMTKLLLFGFATLAGGQIVMGILRIAKAFRVLGAAALAAQLKMFAIASAIGLAVAAVLLIIEDIWTFFQGGDSVFGMMLDGAKEFFSWIGDKLVELKDSVMELFGMAAKFLSIGERLSGIGGFFGFGDDRRSPGDSAPAGMGASSQQFNLDNEITVNVGDGASAADVGEAVQSGVSDSFETFLRRANRSVAPGLGY
jgi:hypothetical protein